MTNLFRGGGHQPDIEVLSGHVDGRLDAAREQELEAHLPTCDACRAALAELSLVRTSLGAMPDVEAPRSFRLRVADIEPARKPTSAGWSLSRWTPAVGGLAAVLFVVVFSVDRLGQQTDSASDSALRSAGETSGMIAEQDAPSPVVAADTAAQPESRGGAITPPDTGTAIPDSGLADGAFAATVDPASTSVSAGVPAPSGSVAGTPSEGAPDDRTPTDSAFADENTTATVGTAAPATTPSAGLGRSAPGTAIAPPADTAGPTGAPPSGDEAIPAPSTILPTESAETATAPGAAAGVTAGAETPPAGMVPAPDAAQAATLPASSREEQIVAATATPELLALSTEDGGDGGNRNWLLIVEIATAMVAVAAGVFLIARRFVGRGEPG